MHRATLWAASLFISSVLFILVPTFVFASGLTVNNTVACSDTSGAPYCTIQAAINHAHSGDTINVAAGTYNAFSIAGKSNLTVNGAGNLTVIAPTALINTGVGHKYAANMQVSVFVNNSSKITLKNLKIEGNGTAAPAVGGPDALLFWNNSDGTVNTLTIQGTYVINGDQTGQGIAVDAGNGATTLTVNNTTISGFQKNGIDAEDGNSLSSGNAGTISLDVENSSITGFGSTSAIAQNGIVAWNEGGGSVSAKVKGTSFSNLWYSPAGATAAAILAYGSAAINPVSNDTFTNTQIYIGSASSGTAIDATNGNTFDTVTPTDASTGAQLATIENKLSGAMESVGSDPIFIIPKTFIVTPQNLGINTALNLSHNGYTVIVTPGTYSGDATPPASNNVTLEGDGGPVINLGSGYGINLDNNVAVTNFTFSGFTVNASPSTTYAFKAYKADGLTLTGDTFNGGAGNTGGGIDLNTMHNVKLSDVTSSGFHKNGIAVTSAYTVADEASASKNITFDNITSSNNGWTGISFYTVGNDHSPSSIGGSADIKNVHFTGLDNISGNGSGFPSQGGIFIEGDSDANVGAGNAPANTVTGSSTALGIGHVAFASNSPSDITNYQTAQVNALKTTFGGLTGSQMNSAQIEAENLKIYDIADNHALGRVHYYNLATSTLLGWNLQSQAAGLESDPISLACVTPPASVSVDNSMNSLNQRWSAVTGANVKYIRQVSSDGGTTWTVLSGQVFAGPSMGAWSSFDPSDQGKTFDTEVEAFDDYQNDNTIDPGDLVSGWSNDCKITFTGTVPVLAVTTDPANPINPTDATLNGTNGTLGADATSFWYGPTNASPFTSSATPYPGEFPAGWFSTGVNAAATAGAGFSADAVNLTPGQTYYFAAWSEVAGVWYPGAVVSFVAGASPATPVTTDPATAVDATDATLNGTDGPTDADNTSFWYGPSVGGPFTPSTVPYPGEFPAGWSSTGVNPPTTAGLPFSQNVSGLITGDTYNYAAWVEIAGTWYPGATQSFVAQAPAPSVTTDAPDTVTSSDANLNATNGPVDAQGHSFWVSTTYIATSSSGIPAGVYSTPDMGAISANGNFTATLSSLMSDGIPGDLPTIQPNTTYYYVAWVNVGGTWYPAAQEQTFTTANGPSVPIPSVTTDGATNISDADATLGGTVGPVDAQAESFWVSTSTINTSSPTIPDGVYSTPPLSGVAASNPFTDQLSLVTTNGITANGNVNMPDITPSTTYFYVAWAQIGGIWYPGSVESFSTTATPPPTPTANNDTVTTDINTPTTIDVLANDLNATDLASFTQPTSGVVATSGTEILYTPNSNYAGNDSFTYIASGPGGDSNSATVSITVKDTTVPVLTVNGDNPAYVEVDSTYSDQGVTVTDTPTNSIGYSVTLDGVATTTSFTLDTSVSGTHTVVYSATDGGGNTGMATRTIDVLDAPTVTLTSTSTSPTTDNPIHVVADFSEPVAAFDETDIDLSSDSLINFAQASSTEYSFDLIPNGANISATIDQHKFTNLAGGENETGATIAFVYSPLVAPSTPTPDVSLGGGGGNGSPVCGIGDLNCDGSVNIQDLNILLSDWGATGTNLAADLNHDGKVDFPDIAILLGHWTH